MEFEFDEFLNKDLLQLEFDTVVFDVISFIVSN